MAKVNLKAFHGPKLQDAGFKLVPIKKGEKQPMTKKWPEIRSTMADVNKWASSSYYGGLGVLGKFNPGIDIDVTDPKIVDRLVNWITKNLGKAPLRIGNAPRVLIPCTAPPKGIGPDYSPKFQSPDGVKHQIEIKATGQQWVAYGVHPTTGKNYIWMTPDGDFCELHDFESDWLPEITGEFITKLYRYFESLVPKNWKRISDGSERRREGGLSVSGEVTGQVSFENYKPPLNITPDKIRSMLNSIDPDTGYDHWLKIGMALCHQFEGSDEGKELYIEWSKNSDNYDFDEIEYRWPTFRANSYGGSPVTAATIVKFYNDTQKKSTDPTRKLKSFKLSDWEKRFVIVEQPDTTEVHDAGVPIYMARRRLLRAFKEHNSGYMHQILTPNGDSKNIPMVDAWRDSLSTRHFAGYTYQPGRDRFCTLENAYGDDSLYVNTFFFPPHSDLAENDLTPFSDFMEHLFPVEAERNWVIMWLARLIQFPETRSFVTPISITNVTGTGRGIFFEILRLLVGGHNCHDVSRDDMEGRFNSFLDKCLIAVVQEIKANTGERKYQMWERMKSLLADNTANIQQKGKDSYTSTIYANFIMFSNNIDALPIQDVNERRIYAMKGADRPISTEEIETILDWKKDPSSIAALFNYLKTVKVDNNLFKRAPVSETKKQMVKSATGLGNADLNEWLVDEAPQVFDYDFAMQALEKYSEDFSSVGMTRQSFSRAMGDKGYHSSRIRTPEGDRVYVYYKPSVTDADPKNLKNLYNNNKKGG